MGYYTQFQWSLPSGEKIPVLVPAALHGVVKDVLEKLEWPKIVFGSSSETELATDIVNVLSNDAIRQEWAGNSTFTAPSYYRIRNVLCLENRQSDSQYLRENFSWDGSGMYLIDPSDCSQQFFADLEKNVAFTYGALELTLENKDKPSLRYRALLLHEPSVSGEPAEDKSQWIVDSISNAIGEARTGLEKALTFHVDQVNEAIKHQETQINMGSATISTGMSTGFTVLQVKLDQLKEGITKVQSGLAGEDEGSLSSSLHNLNVLSGKILSSVNNVHSQVIEDVNSGKVIAKLPSEATELIQQLYGGLCATYARWVQEVDDVLKDRVKVNALAKEQVDAVDELLLHLGDLKELVSAVRTASDLNDQLALVNASLSSRVAQLETALLVSGFTTEELAKIKASADSVQSSVDKIKSKDMIVSTLGSLFNGAGTAAITALATPKKETWEEVV